MVTDLGKPLVVRVRDAQGQPVPGFAVAFRVLTGQGTLKGVTPTNDQGLAQATWTLGPKTGPQSVEASGQGLTPVVFTAEAQPGAPAMLAVVSGNGQTQRVGSTLNPFVVSVRDGQGNAVPQTEVTFAFSQGTGTLSPTQARANTSGQASSILTLPTTPATIQVTASVANLTPVLFNATAAPATAATLVAVSGNQQRGPVGQALADPLVIQVLDEQGNPVPGVALAWKVTKGLGSLSTPTPTDARGQTQVNWTLGRMAGPQSVEVSAAGVATPWVFEAQGLALAANELRLVSGQNQAGVVSSTLDPFVLSVHDRFGNPVAQADVSFQVSTGQGTLSATPVPSDLQGVASVVLTLPAQASDVEVTASTAGVNTPLVFKATAVAKPSTPAGPAAKISLAAGNDQRGTVNRLLSQPLAVLVQDAQGKAVPNAPVEFAVGQGGGALSQVMPSDVNGIARAQWSLGTQAGVQTATAMLVDSSNTPIPGSPITFSATATPGAVAALRLVSGDEQRKPVGSTLDPLVLSAEDAFGNPVPQTSVEFQVTEGTATPSKQTATTNDQGQAMASLTLGSAGAIKISAVATGVTPLVFTATGEAPQPTQLIRVAGDQQMGQVGSALANPLVVRALDAQGNPVAGFAVAFRVTAGGGSVSSPATTGADGMTQVTWTLGSTVGSGSVEASGPGLTAVVFQAMSQAGPAETLTYVSGNNQSMTVGSTLMPFVVDVRDRFGNLVSGVRVTFSAPAGTLSPAAPVSNAQGQAQTTYTLPTTAGKVSVVANATGVASPVSFAVEATPPAQPTPTKLAVASGDNQQALAGTALPQPLVVVLTDSQGTPVPGSTITFAAFGGGTLSATTATTDANGHAQTMLTLGSQPDTNTVRATLGNLEATFTATGSPVTYDADIAPLLVAKNCTTCHTVGPPPGVLAAKPLTTYEEVTTTRSFGDSPLRRAWQSRRELPANESDRLHGRLFGNPRRAGGGTAADSPMDPPRGAPQREERTSSHNVVPRLGRRTTGEGVGNVGSLCGGSQRQERGRRCGRHGHLGVDVWSRQPQSRRLQDRRHRTGAGDAGSGFGQRHVCGDGKRRGRWHRYVYGNR